MTRRPEGTTGTVAEEIAASTEPGPNDPGGPDAPAGTRDPACGGFTGAGAE